MAEAGAPGCIPTPDGKATHCIRETTADAVSSIGLMPLSGVDITVRMPAGSTVKAGCYNCAFLEPGPYQAKIDKHGIKLEYKTVGNPEYNKDGTLKKPGKVTTGWATFRFEDQEVDQGREGTAPAPTAQPSAPPVPDQKVNRSWQATAELLKLCSAPPAFDQKSVAVFEQQAANGDAAAQCGLGMMYNGGQGVPQDYAQAATWWRKAAEQGNAEAQFMLGTLYDMGQGVPQDYTQAVAWFRKAADQGKAAAQWSLGALYDMGQGVPQDYTQAVAWFRKAAEQGYADAQKKLAAFYYPNYARIEGGTSI
ncbi:MAG: tetratricopeptide repeat protein [Terriglobia bacterium]